MKKIFAEDGIVVGDIMYFVSRDMPVLYKIDRRTKEVYFVGILHEENISLKQASRKIVKVGNELVIVPYNASHIYIYDLSLREISDIGIPEWNEYEYMYIEAFAYEGKVIMIGAFAKNIIELDMATKEITVKNTYFEEFDESKDMFCRSGYVVFNDDLYIGLAVDNSVLKINLKTWDYLIIKVGNSNNRFSGIAFDGNYFWLTARRGKEVIVWDGSKQYDLIDIPFEVPEDKCAFGGVYYYGGKVWLHGFEEGYSVTIDPIKRIVTDYYSCRYRFYRNVDDKCIIGQDWDGIVHLRFGNDVEYYNFEISEDMLKEIKKLFSKESILGKNGIVNETGVFGINEFVEMIMKQE